MKKILILLTLIFLVILTACKDKSSTKTDVPDTQVNQAKEIDEHQPLQKPVWMDSIDERFWSQAADVMVTVYTAEIKKLFPNVVEFHDPDFSDDYKIIFVTKGKGVNIGYLSTGLEYNEEEGTFFINVTDELCIQHITSEIPLVVNWKEVGTFPTKSFFIEENNNRRYFSIYANNAEPNEGGYAPIIVHEKPLYNN